MKFPMIQADAKGETHFGVHDIQDRELAMGPPPNPMGQMSDFGAVTTMCAISFPAGTEAPAQPARVKPVKVSNSQDLKIISLSITLVILIG